MDTVTALESMGGGMWSRADCEAALSAAAGASEGACELLLGGFTAQSFTAAAGGPAAAPVMWSFDDGAHGWQTYDAATRQLLEDAHSRGDPTASFSFGRWSYTVSLQGSLVQTNDKTGMTRAVHRGDPPAAPQASSASVGAAPAAVAIAADTQGG